MKKSNHILNVATFNISGGVSKEDGENYFDQEKSSETDKSFLREIISYIKKEQIDIIAFQEIITTDRIKYIDTIIDQTELKYASIHELSECNLVENTNCGLAIVSKYPIIDEIKIKFTNPHIPITTATGMTYFSFDKGLLKVKIDIEGKVINLTTCHFLPFKKFKADPTEYRYLFKELETVVLQEDSFILTGDFNTDGILNFITDIDQKTVKLFDKMIMNGKGKYDNILITKDYKSLGTDQIKSMSDHYLCIAHLQIK